MITKKDKGIDPNVPRPPLTNEVELISLEEIESEYEGMRTIRSVLKSVIEKPSPETQCSCKKSRERGQKFVKIGFGSARTFLHPRCGPWIQESKLEPQRWKCKYGATAKRNDPTSITRDVGFQNLVPSPTYNKI
ncbi:hypothetical protein [Pasteuria penetrans]|uniref:hypothetical protein n=1 Tax=Pasteuria penetrans TaxID=86005 RepID=UPI000F90DF95|nr:hypothetical protein [Pasteuria penetrans]